MADEQQSFRESHRTLARAAAEAQRFAVQVPFVGRVGVPRPEQVAFVAGLGALVMLDLIEWPVAVALGVGQILLSEQMSTAQGTTANTRPA